MPSLPDLRGTVLDGRYQIVDLLGEGGMGYVFEAMHVTLGRRLAIKTLHPRLAYDERFRERFLREAKAASTIRHPNVVQIMDFGDTPDGSVYFVMEFLDGYDLRALLRRDKKLAWPHARHILQQAISALAAAHRHSIIHRDIKPGNCFLTPVEGLGDVVKLLDFGIAKVGSQADGDEDASNLTNAGEVFGTATYMAPEQARGLKLDARSDVYSLGIMAYEMVTGQVPYTGVNPIHVITQHLSDAPKPPRSIDPSISPAVEAMILKAIAKSPDDRFLSMGEFDAALMEIPAEVAPTKSAPPAPSRRKRTVMFGDEPPIDAGTAARSPRTPAASSGQRPKVPAPPLAPKPRALTPPKSTAPRRASPKASAPPLRKPKAPPRGAPPKARKPKATIPFDDGQPIPRSKVPTAPVDAPQADSDQAPAAAAPKRRPRVTMLADGPPAAPTIPPIPSVAATSADSAAGMQTPAAGAENPATNPPPGGRHDPTSPSISMVPVPGTGPLARHTDNPSDSLETGTHAVREDSPRNVLRTVAIALSVAAVAVASISAVVVFGGDEDASTSVDATSELQGESPATDVEEPVAEHPLKALSEAAIEADPAPTPPPAPEPDPSGAEDPPATDVEPPPPPVPSGPPEEEITEETMEPDAMLEEQPDVVIEDEDIDETPAVPNHLTTACEQRRLQADEAKAQLQWADVVKATALSSCWSRKEMPKRNRMRVTAFANLGNYKKCVGTGRYLKDPQVVALVERCRSKL